MFLSRDREKFVRAVGIIVAIQGILWLSLAIAAIVVQSSPPKSLTQDLKEYTSYSQYLARIIYNDFIVPNPTRNTDKVIRPEDFNAFLWIYATLSTIWVVAAFDQNLAVSTHKPRQMHSMMILGVILLVTSVIDLVFVSLLARDFHTCPFVLKAPTPPVTPPTTTTTPARAVKYLSEELLSPNPTALTDIDCQVSNGIVMSLAARGYVLWLINVILAISLITIGAKAIKRASPTLLTYGTTNTNTIPRVKIPEARKVPSPYETPTHNAVNEFALYGSNKDVYMTPLSTRENKISTPMALNNKNQSIYF